MAFAYGIDTSSFGEASLSVSPELLEFLVELVSTRDEPVRRALEEMIYEYIDEWLLSLRPLPYVPNLVVEAASKKRWIDGVVEKLGASVVIDAMKLAVAAKNSTPDRCAALLETLREVEMLLVDAMGVKAGEAIRKVLSSNDCLLHASLIASLIATKPWRG